MKININLWEQVSLRWVRQMSAEKQISIEMSAATVIDAVIQQLEVDKTAKKIRHARDEVLFLITQNDDDDDDDFI